MFRIMGLFFLSVLLIVDSGGTRYEKYKVVCQKTRTLQFMTQVLNLTPGQLVFVITIHGGDYWSSKSFFLAVLSI